MPPKTERLQKILAGAGVGSRRACESLIRDGRVRVNGRIIREMGVKASTFNDKIEVDGKRVVAEKPVYYVINKPRAVVATMKDPEGRATIASLLETISERVFPVGRLDYHTSGVLLCTNDGELSDALTRPAAHVPKIYVVKFHGHLTIPDLDRLRNGVELDDGYTTRKAELFVLREEGNNTWVQVTLTEGKNRQIHRMGDAIHHRVMRLSRIEFAGVTLAGIRPGEFRPLKKKELETIQKRQLRGYRQTKRDQPDEFKE